MLIQNSKFKFYSLGLVFIFVMIGFGLSFDIAAKPKTTKKFQFVNNDLAAYMIYFGCEDSYPLKQEVGPGESIELKGNDKSCQIMVRPSAAIHTKIFQKSCDLAATVTILNGKVEISGCQAE